MKTIVAYTDGGSRGNPGPSGLGVYIVNESGEVIAEVKKFLGDGTNNTAEYQAVVTALKTLKRKFGIKTQSMQFEIRMDSELIQRQLNGVYRVKHPNLIPLYTEIEKLRCAHFPYITFVHVRRELNKEADRLANEAMDAGE